MSLVSLYDEASLWMTPSGAKDGRLFSELPVPVYGPELVRNGGFDSGTGWSTPSGWSISNGTLQGTNVAAVSATQAGITFLNKSFRVEYTITEISQGDVRIYLGGTQNTPNRNAVGTYVEYIDITTANTTLYIQGINNFTGKIDNISVKEVSNIGDFTFSRGSNLAATRVDVNGLIEKGRENLLLQSNSFDEWSITSGSSITSGQSGYDGSNDAWLMTDSGFNSAYCIYTGYTYTGVQTFSLYAKQGGTSEIEFDFLNGSGGRLRVDLTNGSVQGLQGTIDYNIEDVGNDWWRLSIAVNNTTAPALVRISCDGAGSVYIQDAQVELGLVATDYIESGATTGKAGLLENEPRLDYSEGATCPSLLLEPSRTNLITHSEYLPFGSSFARSTFSYNDTTSPEGFQNATKWQMTSDTGSHYLRKGFTTTDTYSVSVFAKKGNYRYLGLRSGSTLIAFDFDTETFVGGTGTKEQLNDGWWRLSVTAAGSGFSYFGIHFANASGGEQSNADGTEYYHLYGFQVEAGSYATSYIPNHSGGSVTRGADDCKVEDLQSNGIVGNTWTYFFEWGDYVAERNFEMKDSTSFNFLFMVSRLIRYIKQDTSADTLFSLPTNGTSLKALISYDGTTLKGYLNGSLINSVTDAQSSSFSDFDFLRLDRAFDDSEELKQLLIFPTALSDADCITLTTL